MSGYTRSKETESVRKEIGESFEDEYREDEERREYEMIVDDLRNNYLSSPPAIDFGMTYINNLPDEQRREVLDDRRILWSAFSTVRNELERGRISNCVLLGEFFFSDRPEWLTMPEMVEAAKNIFGSFLRKGGTEELVECSWVVDNVLCDKESKDFVFATTLGVVDELVSEDNESGPDWVRALGIANVFLKDHRAEVIDFFESRAVSSMDSPRHGTYSKMYEFKHIKNVYPEIFERESIIVAAKRQAAYLLEGAKTGRIYHGFDELTSWQLLFSLTDADLAADEEISRAAREYLVEKLCKNPNADYAADPDFQKCVKIAGAQKSEVYAGIYKDALVASLNNLNKFVQSEEESEQFRGVEIAKAADTLRGMLFASKHPVENDQINYEEETSSFNFYEERMDPEVKEAFKNAFISAARADIGKVCMDLDYDFITSKELLFDEDLAKAKEELLVNTLARISSGSDYKRFLPHFICAVDGQAIQRAIVRAMEIGEEEIKDGEKFVFLQRILEELPQEISKIKSDLDEDGVKLMSLTRPGAVAMYRDKIAEGKDFGWDFENMKDDPAVKEKTKKMCIKIFKKGIPAEVKNTYNLFDKEDATFEEYFESDEEIVEAARIGALVKAEETDSGPYDIKHFGWLADTIFKKHPGIAAEVFEKKYISAGHQANLWHLESLYARLKKVRPEAPISADMAKSSVARYRKEITNTSVGWDVITWLEDTVFAAHPDVVTREQRLEIIKKGAIHNLACGSFNDTKKIFETYLQKDIETKKRCLTLGLRGLLHKGDLNELKLVDGQEWIITEAPEILKEIAQEEEMLIATAAKVGIMTIGTAAQQFQPSEWSTMAKVLAEGEIVMEDKKSEAVGVSRIRKEIMAEYERAQEFVVFKPYKTLLSYLGDDSESVIWEYLGQRDRHQMLEPVEAFVRSMNSVEAEGGTSRKDVVQDLFARAGMGSGMQADVWRNIMGKITPQIWKLLETTSAYPDTEPPLANKAGINLLRIQNEIKLHQTPELRKAVADIPKDKPELRAYAAELMKYPTINIEAIVRFIKNPKAFWTSRSGAGENNNVVSALLRELDPSGYPNWSAELSRDAIVEGGYDKLNSFEPVAVEWSEMRDVRQRLQVWGNSAEEVDGDKTSGDSGDFKNIHNDIRDKLKKADPLLAEKSDKAVDMQALADYATSDEVLDASVQWCRDKGEVYAKKAVEYGLKQKLAEPKNQLATQEKYKSGLEARLRKQALTDGERAQAEAGIASAAKKIQELQERITAIIRSSELEKAAFISNLEKLKDVENDSSEEKKTIVKEFWARVEETDFKVSILHMAKQLAGKEFASLDEFRDYAVLYADRHELADRLSTFLDEAEESKNIDWYQAEVLKPSSVESAIAGTLSATCDAFGHGKKAHFMANPVCTQFVMRQSKGKPKEWNTDHVISQSLMTDNRQLFDKPQDRWDFFTELVNNGGKIAQALTKIGFTGTVEDFLRKYINAEELIVLDSVEVPVNVQKKMTPNDVYKTLQDAFGALSVKNPRYDKSIRLGTQYSYIKGDSFPHAPNTDVWVAPLAYSDNLGLEQHKDSSIVLRDKDKDVESKKEIFEGPVNVRPARPQDALSIALMEDIAFRRTGGESYITGLLAMTRNLNVACLQSAHNGHAPIAFIEENINDKGEKGVTGYLVAQTRQNGDIYIDDTATTGEVKGTGTRLLMKLLTEAASDEQLKKKTIRMDCRGTTSALAISKPSSISVLEMLGYRLQGPKHEEIATQKSDRLFSYSLVPMGD